MFTSRGYLGFRALGEGADPGAEIAAISQWIEPDAEYRARRESGDGDALIGDGGGAGHLHTPGDGLAVASRSAAIRPRGTKRISA